MDRALLDQLLTVYGRKPALEALRDSSLTCHTLHLAHSNRPSAVLAELEALARDRGISIRTHDRKELARISKNSKQDQGVALDVLCPAFQSLADYLTSTREQPSRRLLALDGVTNPQNLGMIIRSATAGAIDGIVLPRRGNAALGPLVIKASAGTVFRAPILHCGAIQEALEACRRESATICILDSSAEESLPEGPQGPLSVYVLGNESEGVSAEARELANTRLAIPMRNGVESLNVAVTAGLVAFAPLLSAGKNRDLL